MVTNLSPAGDFSEDVESRLAKLGLDIPTLRDVLVAGRNHARTFSHLDPSSSLGISVWRILNRALRECLMGKNAGWLMSDKSFFARVLNDDLNIALYIMRGDDNTGREQLTPSNRCKKHDPKRRQNAVHLKQAICANRDKVSYDHGDDQNEEWFDEMGSGWPYQTWILLHTVSPDTDDLNEIRAEISLPVGMHSGYITKWGDRIILPGLDLNSHAAIPDIAPSDDGAIVAEVKIVPKQR